MFVKIGRLINLYADCMFKTDIKAASRMLPIIIRNQPISGFKFRDRLYFYKTLPMGVI